MLKQSPRDVKTAKSIYAPPPQFLQMLYPGEGYYSVHNSAIRALATCCAVFITLSPTAVVADSSMGDNSKPGKQVERQTTPPEQSTALSKPTTNSSEPIQSPATVVLPTPDNATGQTATADTTKTNSMLPTDAPKQVQTKEALRRSPNAEATPTAQSSVDITRQPSAYALGSGYSGGTGWGNMGVAMNRWLGKNVYRNKAFPTGKEFEKAVKESFYNGRPVVLDTIETSSGPHYNGHRGWSSHILLVYKYNTRTGQIGFLDPGTACAGIPLSRTSSIPARYPLAITS